MRDAIALQQAAHTGPPIVNPRLYSAMRRCFGDVECHGPPIAGVICNDPVTIAGNVRDHLRLEPAGQYYVVDCPFCRQPKKLWINNLYGVIPEGKTYPIDWAAICYYRTKCLNDSLNRMSLRTMLSGLARSALVSPTATVSTQRQPAHLKETHPPGFVVPLTKLPVNHRAISYLHSRGFNPNTLSSVWDVGYCPIADVDYPSASNSIYAPVYMDGKLVGWQTRVPFARKNPYYTQPKFHRSLALYGWDIARRGDVLVIVEGITDVWAVGSSGVAVLGGTLSYTQTQLILNWARSKDSPSVVVALDCDSAEERALGKDSASAVYKDLVNELSSDIVRLLPLAERVDPGDLSPDALWAMVVAVGAVSSDAARILATTSGKS